MRLWTSAASYIDVHPTFFYESLWNVIGLLLLLFIVTKARRFDGENTWFYFLWYGMEGVSLRSLPSSVWMVSPSRAVRTRIFPPSTQEKSKACMTGCKMEAAVTCGTGSEDALTFTLSCDYAPEGETTVEVLSPDTVAGVKAVLTGDQLKLQYEDLCLDAGTLSDEEVSPLMCPARLMSALRSGWLLEQNEEKVGEIPCLRLCMNRLKKVDEVAYVRFASVYRQFKDIDTFMSELNKLLADK